MNHIHRFIISTTWWIERFPTSPDFIYLVSLWCVWRARVWRKKAGMARPFGLGLASSRSSHSFLASPSLPLHVVLARLVKNSWSMDQHIVVSKRQGGGSCVVLYSTRRTKSRPIAALLWGARWDIWMIAKVLLHSRQEKWSNKFDELILILFLLHTRYFIIQNIYSKQSVTFCFLRSW